ncbi:MAG TPA: hypothetical protein DGT21_06240 [Armatimonadetes bacterium]|jgi:hypothetical protein|nr:hypothetical protein [Armatimonadota bacterium]
MDQAQQAGQLVLLGISIDPHVLGLWVQALLTFAILSFLIGDNPVYKFAEHLFVGLSAAYGVVILYKQAVLPLFVFKLVPSLSGDPEAVANYWAMIPGLLGLMIVARFIPRLDWLSRYPIGFTVGLYSGAAIPAVVQANLLQQAHATMKPVAAVGDVTWAMALSSLVVLVGAICTLAYFYFSRPHEGGFGIVSKVGTWILMITFGAGFGNTVMARLSLLIGRVEFLLYDWLHLPGG